MRTLTVKVEVHSLIHRKLVQCSWCKLYKIQGFPSISKSIPAVLVHFLEVKVTIKTNKITSSHMHAMLSHLPPTCAYRNTSWQSSTDLSTLWDTSTGGFLRCSHFPTFILSLLLSLSLPSVFLSFLESVPVETDMNGDKEPDGSGAMNLD